MRHGDRTPVLIGVGQHVVRDGRSPEPLDLLEIVARRAVDDSGATGDVVRALDAVGIVRMLSGNYADPPGALAARLGASPRSAVVSPIGGTMGQHLVTSFAERMLAGELDVALVAGAEALATLGRLRRDGEEPAWGRPVRRDDDGGIDYHPAEVAHEATAPVVVYPMLETARRARLGLDLRTHLRRIGEMCAPMTRVAAANPYAWFPVARTAAEISTPAPANRWIAHPYLKYMVAVMNVDQAAAVLLATRGAADDLGVPEERRVYLHGWAEATDVWYVAQRPDLSRSPAMAAASAAAFRAAAVGVDDLGAFDFYSCFPVAVATAAETIGLDVADPRRVTVTGGLPYAGGPANNYTLHSVATMVDRLRGRDVTGCVSGVSWFLTKHSWAVYGGRPPAGPVTPPDHRALQERVDAEAPARPLATDPAPSGPARIVGYSVVHDRDGSPTRGVAVAELDDGRRCWAELDPDPGVLAAAVTHEFVGRGGTLVPRGGRVRFVPSG